MILFFAPSLWNRGLSGGRGRGFITSFIAGGLPYTAPAAAGGVGRLGGQQGKKHKARGMGYIK